MRDVLRTVGVGTQHLCWQRATRDHILYSFSSRLLRVSAYDDLRMPEIKNLNLTVRAYKPKIHYVPQ